MVGSELQFMTPFPEDNPENADNADCLACRNIVFRLRETLTFQKLVSKVFATLQWFAHEVPRTLFFIVENRG